VIDFKPGEKWPSASLIWGEPSGAGDEVCVHSPLGGPLQSVQLLSCAELSRLFSYRPNLQAHDVTQPLNKLKALIEQERALLQEALRLETGFSLADCSEIIDGAVAFLDRFDPESHPPVTGYSVSDRRIEILAVPYGTVAAILPQNAFLSMSLIVLASALAGGNRVILRVPTGCARLGPIIGQLLLQAGFSPESFSVVFADPSAFTKACMDSRHPVLVHYMGSSDRAGALLQTAFDAGKPMLVDGEGNTHVYVHQDQDPSTVARLLWMGALRYNGQTCTSINGAILHPLIEADVRVELKRLAMQTTFGLDDQAKVGPMLKAGQATFAVKAAAESQGVVVQQDGSTDNLLAPILVMDPDADSVLVRQGIFAPVLWVRTGNFEEFERIWNSNHYPLCAGVLANDSNVLDRAKHLAGASRIVLNGDPSLEDSMEPWGGYPPCGSNPVSDWISKYRRTVQIDQLDRA